jgi:hypothetical protein
VSRQCHRLSHYNNNRNGAVGNSKDAGIGKILPVRVRTCTEILARTLVRGVRSQRRRVTDGGEEARQVQFGRCHDSAHAGCQYPPCVEALPEATPVHRKKYGYLRWTVGVIGGIA